MKSETPPCVQELAECGEFAMQFTSTRRSVGVARRLAVQRLELWGHAREGEVSEAAALLIAELAGNAVLHCKLPGRDFHLRVTAAQDAVRIEVSDACRDRRPTPASDPWPRGETGRGLLIVEALADAWGVTDRQPIGKTIWAELHLG